MLQFDANGLIAAIVQDANTRQVLMLGYMDAEALRRTVASGQVWFWSRSRGELWHKGATSGNFLNVRAVRVDCDGDALLVEAEPVGPTCHTGAVSCFFGELPAEIAEATGAPGEGSVMAAGGAAETTDAGRAPGEGSRVAAAGVSSEPAAGAADGPALAGQTVEDGSALDGRMVEALFAVIEERQRLRPEDSYVVKLLDAGVDRIAKKIGEEATEVVIAAKNGDHAEITWEVADLWFHSLVLLASSGLRPAAIWQELDRRRR
jgi:phosphoribosyl-AMP cyclohydrolase / phosphoribosyl-ATP pyrophosphohydrolase